jgi:flagellar export protein FliJ
MTSIEGAGLRAVARVRAVREQDSMFGLQQAMRESRECQDRLATLDDRLGAAPVVAEASVDAFLHGRHAALAIGGAVTRARQALETSETVAIAALTHWQHDKTRCDAIELLQERRAVQAGEAQARREGRDLDEIATQLWRRRRLGGEA